MDSEQRDRLKILVKERDAKAAIESARRHGLPLRIELLCEDLGDSYPTYRAIRT